MSDCPVNILSDLKNKLVVKDRPGGYENLSGHYFPPQRSCLSHPLRKMMDLMSGIAIVLWKLSPGELKIKGQSNYHPSIP